jgi:glycosyltransferase involved in cell wall biosynthesis
MLVTVALPVYNGLPYLGEAIESILGQDVELELIVSDDASSDESVELVKKFADSDSRLRLILNEKNVGIFGNLNRCIVAARGQFIQIFSQDDRMRPGYLSSQLLLLDKYPSAGLVYGANASIDQEGELIPSTGGDDTPEFISQDLYLWIASHYGALPASISSIMVPKRTFDSIGLFNMNYRVAGDIEFYNRVSERFPVVRNMEVLHEVRSHRGMTSALSTSGPLYLSEELALNDWYRSHWNARAFRQIRRFRAGRARYHLGWITRLAIGGRLTEAVGAVRSLGRIYPLHYVIWYCIVAQLRPGWRPRPTEPPPQQPAEGQTAIPIKL